MHVRYRFPVTGRLRLEYSHPVRTQIFVYTVEVDRHGVVTHLNATAAANDRRSWPVLLKDPEPGIKAHIQMNSPYFHLLQREMRAVAGILALYGVDEIKAEDAEEIWEPENQEEKDSLAVYSMKRTMEATSPETWPRVPFGLVACALLAAERAADFETALNFFRKGKMDVRDGQYIDAVLDFLFMLETTYANGKFKTAQVEQEYLSSAELHQLVRNALGDKVLLENVRGHARIEENFRRTYVGKSTDQVIAHLVKLRGELHHHTSRRSGIWHPTDHVRFGADAYVLQQLCLGVAFAIASPTLFDESIGRIHTAQEHASAASGSLSVHSK